MTKLSGKLFAGYAKRDITPPFPCAVQGQGNHRIAHSFVKPLYASALVLETRNGSQSQYSVWVSLDVGIGHEEVQDAVAAGVAHLGIAAENVFLGSMHTHDASFTYHNPLDKYFSTLTDTFPEDYPGIWTPEQNIQLIVSKSIEAIEEAFANRKAARFGSGTAQTDISHNRYVLLNRYTRKDIDAPWEFAALEDHMYGWAMDRIDPANPLVKYEFAGFVGRDGDDLIHTLGFWDEENKLIAVVAGAHCPAQTSDNDEFISSDMWGYVREYLAERLGLPECPLVSFCLFAGDIVPYQPEIERSKRGNLTEVVSDRLTTAILLGLDTAKYKKQEDVVLAHEKFYLDVPLKVPSKELYDKTVAEFNPDWPPWAINGPKGLMERYKLVHEQGITTSSQSFHVLRIGDVGMCTAPYEMFLDYADMLRAQVDDCFEHVLPIQLVGGHFGYLPNRKGRECPSYGMGYCDGTADPEGGEYIIDELAIHMKTL